MAKLLELGWTVSLPYGAKAGYDLIADTGKKIYRIQVKSICLCARKTGSSWIVNFLKPSTRRGVRARYSKGDCDYLVAMCPQNGRCFVFPISVVSKLRQATFRFGGESRRRHRKSDWAMAFEDAWPK